MHLTTSSLNYNPEDYTSYFVSTNTVLTRNVLVDIWISVRMLFGGELKMYAQLVADARDKVMVQLANQAEELGAEVLVGVNIETNSIHPGTIEVLAYGTALVRNNKTSKQSSKPVSKVTKKSTASKK